MSRFLATQIVLLLASGSSLGGEATPPSSLKVGDKVYVHGPQRGASAVGADDERVLRMFIGSVRRGDMSLFHAKNGFYGVRSGTQVEILEINDGETYAVKVPAARVRSVKQGVDKPIWWIPLQYLRAPSDPWPHGEFRLPVFMAHRIYDQVPRYGDEVSLIGEMTGSVYVSKELGFFQEYVKATLANDRKAADKIISSEGVYPVDDYTLASVVSDSPRSVSKSVRVVKVRIIEGPRRNDLVWVAERHLEPTMDGDAVFRLTIHRPKANRSVGYSTAEKPDTLLRSAANLVKSKKIEAAKEYYQTVIRDYPDTPQAETASERLRELGQK